MKQVLVIATLLFCNNLLAQVRSEQFTFELRIGFVKSGEAIYRTKPAVVDNEETVHASLHGYTTGIANELYSVDDKFESYIDKDDLLPDKSLKQLKEQNYRFDEEVTFFHDEETAFSKSSGWHDVKYGICDVTSLMYHLRYSGKLDSLELFQVIEIPFWDTDEWYMLRIKYTGIEKVETDLGSFECIRLEPQEIAGRFFSKKNPMNIWMSNDNKKLPVMMEMNFTIGSFKCLLVKVS